MSGLNKRKKYDDMSTEALNEILRQDFLNTGDEALDEETILYITQLIADREEENPTGLFGDVETSWQNFRQNFIAPVDICSGEDNRIPHSDTIRSSTKKKPYIRALRTVLIAAVVTALLIGAAYAASALGWLPKWTDDHFTFAAAETTPEAGKTDAFDSKKCVTLEDALALHNAPDNIVPTYIPEGYKQVEFNYAFMPNNYTTFGVTYSDGTAFISFSYLVDNSGTISFYTKDDGEPKMYTTGGIAHYIMTNADQYKAIWQNGRYECCISGCESHEELIKAIDSMY